MGRGPSAAMCSGTSAPMLKGRVDWARPVQPPVIILVGTSHPGNVGAAARGAMNFGVTEMRFVAPRCNVTSTDALARAVHAADLLRRATIYATLDDALVGVGLAIGTTARVSAAPNHFLRKPQDVRDWVASLDQWDGQLALVCGREDTGLTREEVNLLDDVVTIPTADYASLNLAHAVTLLCYELFRRDAVNLSPERVLDDGANRAMMRAWDALVDLAENRPWRIEVSKAVFRKMIGRSLPDSHEVHNVMGILTRTLKRFNHPDWKTEHSERFLTKMGLLIAADATDATNPTDATDAQRALVTPNDDGEE